MENRVMKYLAFDIGAREVKYALAERVGNHLSLTKVQSFRNNVKKEGAHLLWELDGIFSSVLNAIRESGPVDSILIDSFASDYVLLDERDEIIGGAVSYLDERTERITELPNEAWIFNRTGFHSRRNSTLYQLLAQKEEESELLERAVSLLFLPDYFNFLLTGVKKTSLSMAATSSLVNAESLDWDDEMISELGLKRSMFPLIAQDGETLGMLSEKIEKEVGFSSSVIVSAHDTSLAYMASELDDDTIMLSVGGFARLGTYVSGYNLSDEVMHGNYTNSVAPGGRCTITKYLMGTMLIQRLKEGMKEGTSYDEIMRKARAIHYPDEIDIGALEYEHSDVLESINRCLEKKGLESIEDLFEASSLVYSSLAAYYEKEIEAMEEVLSRRFSRIFLVGGASKDLYLALLLALKSKREVITGPVDAALSGNLIFQMIQSKEVDKEEKDTLIKKALGRMTIKRMD